MPPTSYVPTSPPDKAEEPDFRAEKLVAELLRSLGYQEVRELTGADIGIDIVGTKDGSPVAVQISLPTNQTNALADLRIDAARLQSFMPIDDAKQAIIAIFGPISATAKEWAESQFDLSVWDINALLEMAQPFPTLHREFKGFAKEITPSFPSRKRPTEDAGAGLIRELESSIHNNGLSPDEYEELCRRAFIYVFDPQLYGFKKQAKTTDGANRYDFICRIQSGHRFWDDLRADFRTKAILFECKNYDGEITADQVYSTERYLFTGALRTVCFLISRLGPDDGCKRAAQGAMRESGKLILLLSNQDLIDMIKLKSDEGGPENFLDEKIWDFIISLPR